MNNKNKYIMISIFMILLVGVFAYRISTLKRISKTDKPIVIATLYPQYDFLYQLLGDRVTYVLLLPPGAEAHSYEPTPWDLVNLKNAELIVYTSEVMEPWITKVINQLPNNNFVNASELITLVSTNVPDGMKEEAYAKDPHVWMDPILAIQMLEIIKDESIASFPQWKEEINQNYSTYKNEITQVDNAYRAWVNTLEDDQKQIAFGGHYAFGYFSLAYDFTFISPFKNYSPDAEPTVSSIILLLETMNSMKHPVIFYEELSDPKISNVIAKESKAELLELNSIHNVSKEAIAAHRSYVEYMLLNLEALKKGISK